MGAVNSCCIPRKSCDCGSRSRTSTPRGKLHRRNLSDTFNLSVIDDATHKAGKVNINGATEEEFMTLPGINRTIASNIIDYRNQIGGFRCVEDLALASGVGAERLSNIRHDIYVMNIPNETQNSPITKMSTQTRRDFNKSFSVQSNVSTQTPDLSLNDSDLVNINLADVSDLAKVKNIGKALAENIVEHRSRRGQFKSLEELSDVRGIGPVTLKEIKPYLIVEGNHNSSQQFTTPSPVHSNGQIGGTIITNNSHDMNYFQRSSTEQVIRELGPSDVPKRLDVGTVSFKYNNKPIVRVASWNVKQFNLAKAKHPGVKDIICMTILENGLGIIAFQELTNKDVLTQICEELNHPSLPNVTNWKGRKGQWEFVMSSDVGRMFQGTEYSGFIYDKSQKINLISSSIVEKANDSDSGFTRKPFLAAFKINRALDCILISLHLKATGLHKEDSKRTQAETDKIQDIIKAVHGQIKDEDDIIILGDFNLGAESTAFNPLRHEGYTNCIPASSMTNIGKNNPNGTKSFDNIWVSKQTQQVLAGEGHVVRKGLWSPWIPYNWGWGGYVSDHCPVFTQLYTSRDLDNGDIQHAKMAQFTIGSKAG